MNIRIDKSAGIRILELARFAECHGCELVNHNDEILIRSKRNTNIDNSKLVTLDMDFGLPLKESKEANESDTVFRLVC